jgi:hypothetical protein
MQALLHALSPDDASLAGHPHTHAKYCAQAVGAQAPRQLASTQSQQASL